MSPTNILQQPAPVTLQYSFTEICLLFTDICQILNNTSEYEDFFSKTVNIRLKLDVQSSPFRVDTFTKLITLLIHCSVNNVVIKETPLFNQSFFQMSPIWQW